MDIELKEKLKKPLMIKDRLIDNRLVLAPMSGLGHIAFRELLEHYGGYGLLFSEMCSARAVPQENQHVSPVFSWREQELALLVCQIFGSDPTTMARAALRVEKEGFFGIDINFGCSVAAICKKNCGAALLKNPKLAVEIVQAVRKAVSIPVFVKFRTGWKDDPRIAVDFSRRFEDAGSDALTFHPRVAPDRRSRPPRWEHIERVRERVSIPVFGNGNVFDERDCLKILNDTGCAGVAIGRIAIARPWIFSMWTGDFSPGPEIYRETALKMAELLEKHYDPARAVQRFKKFAIYFAANFRFGHSIYGKLCRASDMQAIRENICRVFEKKPETVPRPNMNLFSN
ncbi:MAG: tRNA-dihydrouridine synthase family protein [Desulfobacterales bacterium]